MKIPPISWFYIQKNKYILFATLFVLALFVVVGALYYFFPEKIRGKICYAERYLGNVFGFEASQDLLGYGHDKDGGKNDETNGIDKQDSSKSLSVLGDYDLRLGAMEIQFDQFLQREKNNQSAVEELKTKLEKAIAEVSKNNSLLIDQNKVLVAQLNQIQSTKLSDIGSNVVVGESVSPIGKININTATEVQLDSLDGIGPSTAKKIIEYRVSKGAFKSIEDIMNVSGIGESTFNKIKDKIQV